MIHVKFFTVGRWEVRIGGFRGKRPNFHFSERTNFWQRRMLFFTGSDQLHNQYMHFSPTDVSAVLRVLSSVQRQIRANIMCAQRHGLLCVLRELRAVLASSIDNGESLHRHCASAEIRSSKCSSDYVLERYQYVHMSHLCFAHGETRYLWRKIACNDGIITFTTVFNNHWVQLFPFRVALVPSLSDFSTLDSHHSWSISINIL